MLNIVSANKPRFQYLASLSDRVPSYLFPILLMFIEWSLRFAFKISTQEFIGPTLAVAGVSMTISLTSYESAKAQRTLPPDILEIILKHNLKVETSNSRVFRNSCWIATLFLTILWILAMLLSVYSSNLTLGSLPLHYYPGFISYIVGIILSEVKEKI